MEESYHKDSFPLSFFIFIKYASFIFHPYYYLGKVFSKYFKDINIKVST